MMGALLAVVLVMAWVAAKVKELAWELVLVPEIVSARAGV